MMVSFQIFIGLILIVVELREVESGDVGCKNQTMIKDIPDTVQPCVKEIQIIDPESYRITNYTFKNVPNVKVIAILWGNFTIDRNTFDHLTKLEHLELDGMLLRPLPWTLFQHTPTLRFLSLGWIKGLHFSDSGPLVNAPQITTFKLIRALETGKLNPKSFKYLTNLTYLDLSDNGLDEISKDYFRPLSKLKVLKLDKNNLYTLPSDLFEHLSLLEEVSIRINQLISLPDQIFYNLPNLEFIDLSVNRLRKIPTNLIKKNFNLKELDLNINKITYLDLKWNHPYGNKIEWINLSNNSIKILPKHLAEFTDEVEMFLNPIHCDCEMYPFLNKTFILADKPCETPGFLKDKNQSEVVSKLKYCENEEDNKVANEQWEGFLVLFRRMFEN